MEYDTALLLTFNKRFLETPKLFLYIFVIWMHARSEFSNRSHQIKPVRKFVFIFYISMFGLYKNYLIILLCFLLGWLLLKLLLFGWTEYKTHDGEPFRSKSEITISACFLPPLWHLYILCNTISPVCNLYWIRWNL